MLLLSVEDSRLAPISSLVEGEGGQSNGQVLTEEKLCETGTRLEHSPQKSLRCLAQEMGFQVSSVLYFQILTSIHESKLFMEVPGMPS
jgi:hypothetical protein